MVTYKKYTRSWWRSAHARVLQAMAREKLPVDYSASNKNKNGNSQFPFHYPCGTVKFTLLLPFFEPNNTKVVKGRKMLKRKNSLGALELSWLAGAASLTCSGRHAMAVAAAQLGIASGLRFGSWWKRI